MVYLPSKSVTVPVEVPWIRMDAPISGSPLWPSVTVPEIWALKATPRARKSESRLTLRRFGLNVTDFRLIHGTATYIYTLMKVDCSTNTLYNLQGGQKFLGNQARATKSTGTNLEVIQSELPAAFSLMEGYCGPVRQMRNKIRYNSISTKKKLIFC